MIKSTHILPLDFIECVCECDKKQLFCLILFLIFSDHILMIGCVREYTLSSIMLKSNETRPQIKQGYPLNLSILISGGKETNQDSPSNGE